MPSHPLFSDKTIALSSTLAATIGLEEAVLLTVLNDAASLQSQTYARLSKVALRNNLPFWNDDTIRRVLQSLIEKGLVFLSGPMFPEADGLIFSFGQNAQVATTQKPPFAAPNSRSPSVPPAPAPAALSNSRPAASASVHAAQPAPYVANTNLPVNKQQPTQPMPQQWRPEAETLLRLEQHGIPNSFSWAQLDAFVLQAREQGANRNDWNARFFRHVKSQWVFANNDANRQQRGEQRGERTGFNPLNEEATPINFNWQPQAEALQILQRAGIDPQFITDAVPEFVLYWTENGAVSKTWNSKFVKHVRIQWERFTSSMEHSTQPTRIADNWQPSPDCFDIIALAHIDRRFAEQLVPEFVLYWRDSNQMHASWNSRFLQYIKQQWGKRLATASGDTNGQQAAAKSSYSTAQASIQRLNDTSWAN